MEKKIKLYILLAFVVVLLLLGASLAKDFKYSESKGLTYAQKKKDAEYLVHLLKEVYPFYEEERKDGILSSDKRLINVISKTKTDEEFYKVILNTVTNLKHGMAMINAMQLYGKESILLDEKWGIDESNFAEKSREGYEKWSKILGDLNGVGEYITPEILNEYFEGDYFVSASKNPNILPGDKIIKIGGVPIEVYINKNFKSKSGGGYYKYYDSKYEKEVIIGDLINLENKDSRVNITVIGKDGTEKEVEVGVDIPNKPWQVIENQSIDEDEFQKKRKGFLNILENGKVVVMNFSMEGMEDYETIKKDIYKSIDNSEYLILDTRSYSLQMQTFEEIFSYVNREDKKFNRYIVMRKNKYNDQLIENVKNENAAVFKEKFEVVNSKLDELYPPSKYNKLKAIETTIKGLGKYNGKVFIFSDSRSFSISNNLASMVKDNSSIISISDNYLEIRDDIYGPVLTQALLPNSNLVVMLQNSFAVDEEGRFVIKESIKPNYLIDLDKKLYEAKLSGEISPWYYDNLRKYTDKDEYFRKFLEIIKAQQ